MPEGDTIYRSARTLNRALAGKPVTGFRSAYPLLTRFHDNTPLTGQIVEKVESRGKWVLINVLGVIPPDPPPNVPAFKEADSSKPAPASSASPSGSK